MVSNLPVKDHKDQFMKITTLDNPESTPVNDPQEIQIAKIF